MPSMNRNGAMSSIVEGTVLTCDMVFLSWLMHRCDHMICYDFGQWTILRTIGFGDASDICLFNAESGRFLGQLFSGTSDVS
jgi:hypothetical protein